MTGRRLPDPAEVVERALGHSRGEACIVVVEDRSEVDSRFANNTTTTNGWRHQRRVAAVSVQKVAGGLAVGAASRSGDPDLEELVAAAEADARSAPVAQDAASLVAAGGGPRTGGSPLEEPPGTADPTLLTPVLEDLAAAFDRARSAGHVLAGFVTHTVETSYLGTTTGLRLRHGQPTGSAELVARSPDGSRSAWAGSGMAAPSEIDLPTMHQGLEQRLDWASRRVDLPAGRYETILPPDATADLMVFLYEDLSGRDAEDGRSVFSAPGGGTKVGEALTDLPLELRSDPGEPGVQCAPFLVTTASSSDVSVFDNGMALERTAWIEDGRLGRLFYHRAAAARSGVAPAAPIDNLVLELPGATGSVEEMIGRTRRGLLLTCLWYVRTVDPVTALLTGLTRDGVYLVEDGEVVGAVNNFRFNESPVDLLRRLTEVGASTRAFPRESGEWMNRTVMPPVRVAEFNMSSVSPAT